MNPVSSNPAKKAGAASLFTTREMVLAGMFAAVMAVISQLSIPMPTGVPVTIQVFGVALVGSCAWLAAGPLLHACIYPDRSRGLPVFANFGGA